MNIEGIPINSTTIGRCYQRYYPTTYREITNPARIEYLHLWGIRVATCDTSLPDDLVGGLRTNLLNLQESVVSKASTEPSPRNLANLYDAEAKAKGGAAFVMEGQYPFRYIGTNSRWKPLPAFCPTAPVRVYRWMPTPAQVTAWKQGKQAASAMFEADLKAGKVKRSTSSDTCIHRTWGKEKLLADSAGCQVLTDDATLITLGKWADDHIRKKYGNLFVYTLFTKEQFLAANRGGVDFFSLFRNLFRR